MLGKSGDIEITMPVRGSLGSDYLTAEDHNLGRRQDTPTPEDPWQAPTQGLRILRFLWPRGPITGWRLLFGSLNLFARENPIARG
jgi:hypothetical protein